MNYAIKILLIVMAVFVGAMDGPSFALPIGTPLTFQNTVTPGNTLQWTHVLHNADFSPNLGSSDHFSVTDANLALQMDLVLGSFFGIGVIDVTASGDGFSITKHIDFSGPAGAVLNNQPYLIPLGSDPNVLNAMADKSLTISLVVTPFFGGAVTNIDSSEITGRAVVIPDPVSTVVPEPGSLLLLGMGLIGLGLCGRKRAMK